MKITPLRGTGALVAALALAAATLGATAVSASAGPTGTVFGTVAGTDGAPIANTSITFSQGNTANRVPVDQNGSYSVALPPGDYTAQVTDNCQVFKNFAVSVTVAADAQLPFSQQFSSVAEPAPTRVCARVLPQLSGLPQVGVPLTASSGSYAQPVSSITYQWISGVSPIPGATGPVYVPTAADVDRAIYVNVTANSSAAAKSVIPAFPTGGPVRRGDYAFRTGPKVTGLPVIGRSLAVSPGVLVPGASVTYQWFRNGKALRGKTARTYRVAKADYKKKVSAVITYTTVGYNTVVRAVSPSYLPKNKAKISARTSVKKRTATIKVAVSPKASRKSKGKIVILEDGKTLKRASIKSGSTSVKVTGLKKGKHTLTIVYDGKKNIAGTTKTVRIKK